MRISSERIRRDIEAIAAFTATPGEGASRPTFSRSWRAAVDYVVEELRRSGCSVRTDAAGNVHARQGSWDSPVWVSGSHLDSVPNGGDYDGVAGVIVPLEVLRTRGDLPLELVIFAEEEGTTFGRGMLGSHAWAGTLTAEHLATLLNAAGETYLQAGAPHGVQPDRIRSEILRPEMIRGFIEVHIEQGPGLWNRGESVAVVTAIAGRRQLRIRIVGRANHAGSTAMSDRRDALAGASDLVLQLEALAPALAPQTVITVGQITCVPNAVNVVPGEVVFTIDFRSPDEAVLQDGAVRIEHIVRETADRRGLTAEVHVTESLAPAHMDPDICEALQSAAFHIGRGPLPRAVSGALHDAAILAPHVPTAMLFVASRDGVSHNAEEFSRIEDLAAAAEILLELVTSEAS